MEGLRGNFGTSWQRPRPTSGLGPLRPGFRRSDKETRRLAVGHIDRREKEEGSPVVHLAIHVARGKVALEVAVLLPVVFQPGQEETRRTNHTEDQVGAIRVTNHGNGGQ